MLKDPREDQKRRELEEQMRKKGRK